MTTVRCPYCQWLYPHVYLHRMAISDERTLPICGICALEMSNEFSRATIGTTRSAFDGETAEGFRQSAIEWRLRHPQHAPSRER